MTLLMTLDGKGKFRGLILYDALRLQMKK
jgi:hypothetical protein